MFPIGSYVWIWSKSGLSSCLFSNGIMSCLIRCQSLVMKTPPPPRPWLDTFCTPLIPWSWAFSWLCASNVCTPFRCPYAFYAKIYSILYISTLLEDNAFMWFPLAFQVKYMDFYICFIALRVVLGSSWFHNFIECHVTWFIASRLAWKPNVHCI